MVNVLIAIIYYHALSAHWKILKDIINAIFVGEDIIEPLKDYVLALVVLLKEYQIVTNVILL